MLESLPRRIIQFKYYCLISIPTRLNPYRLPQTPAFVSLCFGFAKIEEKIYSHLPPKIRKVDIYWYILYYFVRFYGLIKEKDKFIKEREKEKQVMTVKQVAEYLQMDEHTVYKLVHSGQTLSVKIAGQWKFKKDVIDKWISERSLERVSTN